MKKKQYLRLLKQNNILKRKADKIHDKLFLQINKDIALGEEVINNLFITLEKFNKKIATQDKILIDKKMYL